MKKRNIFTLLLFLAYLAAVAYCCFWHFSELPNIGQDSIFGIPMDKIVHFLMFFPFPFLCFLAFVRRTYKPRHTVLAVGIVFLTGCAIAAGTEIGQSFMEYRSCDVLDFAADSIALAISSIIVMLIDLHIVKTHNKLKCSKK
ncbi:MAG TPA: hypothetical protein DD383_00625 [Rikenellaceae bacterium]|nr:hypothetical protein [Rikenellaceae bacterium]HCQ71996.1 hypothetical protein [Rikenellaceae bacterium]